MEFKTPFKVYTAATNVEAHMIVLMLDSQGIIAHAEEDQSGVSLWGFGVISQFHQPNVWIDKANAEKAGQLIRDFEDKKRQRQHELDSDTSEIRVECEECGAATSFPASQRGTVRDCSECGAFVDVGEPEWDDDFGGPEEDPNGV